MASMIAATCYAGSDHLKVGRHREIHTNGTIKAVTPDQKEQYRKVAAILLPRSQRKSKELYPLGEQSPSVAFVHYTSAEAALNILRTKRLWLRSTRCMADYREIQYGHDMFFQAFNRDDAILRKELVSAMDDCSPGVVTAAIDRFDKSWEAIRQATYVACLSEHDQSENQHGRLSMWRSFAPSSARVAIVLRIPYFTSVTEKLRLIFSPVGYLDQDGVCNEVRQVIKNIRDSSEFLKTEVTPAILYGFIYTMLLAGVTCLKHEGFHEEREWRGIYCPSILPGPPEILKFDLKVIGGVPQKVYELPLCAEVSPDLIDIDLAKIIDHVIVGPSQFSYPMYEAFVDALTSLGVPDAFNRVTLSGIPIRT